MQGKPRPIFEFGMSSDLMLLSSDRVSSVLFYDNEDGRPAVDSHAGSIAIATKRAAAVFLERGKASAGPLHVGIDRVPSLVWAVARDGRVLANAHRIVLGFVTEVENIGLRCNTPLREVVYDRGGAEQLIRDGRARISLSVRPGNWRVFVLDFSGRRVREVACGVRDDRLVFDVDESSLYLEAECLCPKMGAHN